MTVGNANPIQGSIESMDDGDENQMISIIQMESRVHISYLETMFAVGLDGCKQVRQILNGVIKSTGKRVLKGEGGSGRALDE